MDNYSLLPGYTLSMFEIYCTYELLLFYVNNIAKQETEEKYGDANLLNLFVSTGLVVDLAIHLYEYIELLDLLSPGIVVLLRDDPDYSVLRKLRMNMHTYNKNGGYNKEASKIIAAQSDAFDMDSRDATYILRNDISLFYEIKNGQMLFSGSNYYWFHTYKGVEQDKCSGSGLRDFAAKMTKLIKNFRETINETAYNMPPLVMRREVPLLEGFDYKSVDLFERVPLDKGSVIRLQSILYQLSYGLFLTESLLEMDVMESNNLWYCYFLKNIAVKFDESVDNILSMITHGPEEGQEQLKSLLFTHGLDFNSFQTSKIACELRNTIHYQETKLNENLIGDTTASYIEAIYISNTTGESMQVLRLWGAKLFQEARQLRDAIRAIFCLDKPVIN